VTRFELQGDLFAILIETAQAEQVGERLGRASLQPYSPDSPPVCLAAASSAWRSGCAA